jgi:hypothetical protein
MSAIQSCLPQPKITGFNPDRPAGVFPEAEGTLQQQQSSAVVFLYPDCLDHLLRRFLRGHSHITQ